MPYRLKSGSWQPSRLRWIDHAVLMVGLISIAYIRGFDYLIGNDSWGAKDFMIAAAPEWVWGGIGFVAGATILGFGVTTKRHLVVYVGHGWLFAAYALNALALVLASGPEAVVLIFLLTVLLLLSAVVAIHHLVNRGHGFAGFLLLIATAAVSAGGIALSNSFDGVRGGGEVGLVAAFHFIHMLRTGGRPLRVENATSSERVVDGGVEA